MFHVCVCVCVCDVCVVLNVKSWCLCIIIAVIIIVLPLISMCQLLLLWYGVASHSLLVLLGWVESRSIKGSLQTAKYLGAPPLA